MNPKFCSQCGAPLSGNERFCSQCGVPVTHENIPTPAPTPTPSAVTPEPTPVYTAPAQVAYIPQKAKKSYGRPFFLNLITRSLVLFLAIFFVITAFMPILSLPFDYADGLFYNSKGIDIKLNTIDVIALFCNSLYSQSEEEFYESDAYIELTIQNEENSSLLKVLYNGKYDTLSASERSDLNDYYTRYLLVMARRETYPTTVALILTAVCALLYILFTVAFAVISLLCFLGTFPLDKLKSKKLENALFYFVSFAPICPIMLRCATRALFADSKATSALILPLILSLCITVWCILRRVFFEKARYSTACIIKRSFAMLTALLVLCVFCVPLLNGNLTMTFQKQSTMRKVAVAMDYAFFPSLHLNEKTSEYYDNFYDSDRDSIQRVLDSYEKGFASFTGNQVEKGRADRLHSSFVLHLMSAYNFHDFGVLFSLISAFVFFAVLSAALILQQNLRYFLYGKYSRRLVILSKILLGLFSALILTLAIVFLATINACVSFYGLTTYRIGISAGLIVFLALAIATICIPAKATEPKQHEVELLESDAIPQA